MLAICKLRSDGVDSKTLKLHPCIPPRIHGEMRGKHAKERGRGENLFQEARGVLSPEASREVTFACDDTSSRSQLHQLVRWLSQLYRLVMEFMQVLVCTVLKLIKCFLSVQTV